MYPDVQTKTGAVFAFSSYSVVCHKVMLSVIFGMFFDISSVENGKNDNQIVKEVIHVTKTAFCNPDTESCCLDWRMQ